MPKRKKVTSNKPVTKSPERPVRATSPKTASKSSAKAGSKPAAKPAPKSSARPASKAASKPATKAASKSGAKKAEAKKAAPDTAAKQATPTKRATSSPSKPPGKQRRQPTPTRKPNRKATPTGSRKRAPKPVADAPATAPPASTPTSGDMQLPASSGPRSGRISAQELAIELARLANDDKCTDIVVLDVRKLSPISDFVVVASGSSDRQMRAVADHAEELGAMHGHQAFRSSKDPRALWLLIDFSDVVIHIFEPNTRAHYDIEMMWGDAKRIPWEREASGVKPPSRSRKAAAPA